MWKDLKVNNDIYMVRVAQKDDIINVFLTNLIEIWSEKLTSKVIFDRCRNLNPLLNVEALSHNEIVLHILNNMPKYVVEATVERIKLQIHIDGGYMKFIVNLSKGTPQEFWENVTKPLCVSSMEIIRQRDFLIDLIKRKDEEIAEYKAEGAELIRKTIATKTFMEEQLKSDFSIANNSDYTNAFQGMINFYDKFNLGNYSGSPMKSISVDNVCSETKETQNVITTNVSGDNSVCKDTTNEDGIVGRKIENVKSNSEEQHKKVTTKQGSYKSRTTSMAYRPVKKLKKDLHDCIL